jgi:hypothetical protein
LKKNTKNFSLHKIFFLFFVFWTLLMTHISEEPIVNRPIGSRPNFTCCGEGKGVGAGGGLGLCWVKGVRWWVLRSQREGLRNQFLRGDKVPAQKSWKTGATCGTLMKLIVPNQHN